MKWLMRKYGRGKDTVVMQSETVYWEGKRWSGERQWTRVKKGGEEGEAMGRAGSEKRKKRMSE